MSENQKLEITTETQIVELSALVEHYKNRNLILAQHLNNTGAAFKELQGEYAEIVEGFRNERQTLTEYRGRVETLEAQLSHASGLGSVSRKPVDVRAVTHQLEETAATVEESK